MNTLFKFDSPWPRRLEKAAVCLATGFYSSILPPKVAVRLKETEWGRKTIKEGWTGSGLSGSLLGLLTFLLLPVRVAVSPISLVLGVLFAVFISHHAERIFAVHDDSRIVIDEWIGAWIAASCASWHRFGYQVIIAIIFFRICDVYKGPWVRRLQNLPGGWGVVMDDVLAGLIANFLTRVVVMITGVL